MNHSYRLVFNVACQVWQAVAETAKSRTKSAKAKASVAKTLLLATVLISSNAYAELAANALPTGAQVVSGQVSFSQAGNQLNIHQATQKAITNWISFNVGALSEVNFLQNNASSISLNRVLSSDPSQIFGKLNANGQVWLINPNGILFGQSAQVNVGGLLASTLNIADDDFLSGNYKFTGNTSSVVNMGNIVANNGGYVAMFSPQIRNEGIISALEGASILAAGDAVSMSFNNDGLINVQVDSANINTLIENKNLIRVGGGQVLMSSKAADSLMTSVINNTGKIEANSMVADGGVIRLTGAKTVINSGEISATSTANKGGSVHMLGENVGVFDNGSISVNGKTGGGEILVGGDFQGKNANIQNAKKIFVSQNATLSADATQSGDGGKVIVWADDITRYYGEISAKGGAQSGNGGFVEVSGKNYLDFNGSVNTSASHGTAGTLLLDPTNITISTGVNSIESSGATTFQETTPTATSILNTTTLQTALASNNVNVTTASAAASAGTITVANAITWASGNSLTLTADSTIAINAAITTGTAASALILNATGNVTQGAAGIIGGAGGVTKNGAGTFTANRTNTYTGTTTINAGTITMGANNVFADASTILVNGGTLDANTRTDTVAGVRLDSGSITGTTGALTSTTAYDLRSGTVTKILGGAVGLNKTTAGTVTLGGANTYTGATTITAGTLALNATGTIAASSGVANNGTFSTAAAKTIDSMTGAGATVLGGTLTIGDASNTSSTYTGVASGAGGITKAGTGTLTLSGANTYTGATNVNAGTLIAANNTALGGTGSGTTVATGATLALQGGIAIGAEALSINGAGLGANGALRNISGNNTYGGVVTLAGASEIQSDAGTLTLSAANAVTGTNRALTVDGAGNTNINGTITTGTGTLTKTGTGTLTLSGANTYTGATTVNTGTLVAANNTALGTTAGATTVASGATLVLQGGITTAEALTLTGTGVGAGGALRNLSGNNTATGAITLGAGGARINSDAGLLTISGAGNITGATQPLTVGGAGNTTISKIIATTTGTLTKDGAGTLTLSGINTYTGNTTVNAGILRYGASNAISTGNVIVNDGGTYDLAGFNDTIGALTVNSGTTGGAVTTGAGTLTLGGNVTSTGGANNATISGNLALGATRTFTVTNAADGLNVSAIVSGAAGLNKAGNGTLTLSGANTYTGATAINTGALVASNANALGAVGGGTTVASGATLNVNGVTLAESALSINGVGVGGAGALTGTGAAVVNGAVTTTGASNIGTTSVASALTINGVSTATAGNLGIVGLGDVTATNAGNNFGTVNINGAKNVSLRDTNAITIGNGASNLTGNLTVQAGGNVTVANNITTTGGDITLAGINFINTAGALALSASGRWLVYSTAPAADTFGGLLSGNQAIWNTVYPIAVSQTGNRYVFTSAPALTVTSTNQSKTYGQNGAPIVANAFTATGFIDASLFGGVFTQDDAANALSGSATSTGSATTASVAGGPYAISVAPITATTGYTLTKNSTGNLTVNQAALTVTADNQTKTYGNNFTFAGTEFTNSALQNGETIGSVTLDSTGKASAADVNVYAITASNATGGTFNAANYNITYATGSTMTVNPAIINLSGSRTYNGTTVFNPADFGVINGVLSQTLNLTGAGSVASANAGAAQTLTLGGLALTNGTGLASNYTLTGGTHMGTINQANLTISTSDVTKTYDGSLAALGTAIVTSGTLFTNASNGNALDTISGGTFAYTNANAGSGNKTVTTTGVTVTDGNSGGNYNVTYADNTTSTINQANLTISTSDVTKTYDGTLAALGTATITSGTLFTNASNGNTLDAISGGTFAYTNANAGIGNKTVTTTGVTVTDGNSGGNYNVLYADNTTSTINKAGITVTTSDVVKTYDGTTAAAGVATLASGTLFNNASNGNALDNLSGGSFAFTNKNFGIGNKTVTVAGVSVNDGNSGGNYNVLYANNTTSTINKAALSLNAVTDMKTYDGNTNSTGVVGIVGLQTGDSVTAAQSFDNKNAGARTLAVNAGYAINDGNSGGNYTVTTNTAAGTIEPKALTVTANNQTKTYGQTITFAGSEFTSAGLVGLETIGSASLASAGAANTANVAGSAYAITASNATGGTFDANNYAINYVNGSLTVNRAALTVAANNATKAQGSPNPVFGSTITGFVNGETSAVLIGVLNHSTPAVTTSPAGFYAITPLGLTADNYTIAFVDGVLTVGRPANISVLSGALTRPEQAVQTCTGEVLDNNAMISGLDAFDLDDVEYKEPVNQPLVGGTVANALVSPACLKL